MKRKAFLIEASRVSGLDDLPGARVDIESWRSFLSSPMGGAWENNEIAVLNTPSRVVLQALLDGCRDNEYLFIAFSGHGYHLKGQNIDETRICLRDKDEVSVRSLNNGVPKITLVVDSCRQVQILEEKEIMMFAEDALRKRMVGADREAYRKRFNDQIKLAPAGIEILYSCDLDEAANETRKGGAFTQAMLRVGEDFNEKERVLTVDQAFSKARTFVSIKYPQQHPVFEGGRRLTHYPFAVYM